MADAKFVPEFLLKLGLKPGKGEWTYHSKLSIKALMRPNFPLKVRIWACLSIQTFGYKCDLGVVMKKQKGADGSFTQIYEPLTPAEIAKKLKFAAEEAFHQAGVKLSQAQLKELFVQKSSVRRVLADMEANDGLIVRAVTTTGTSILSGLTLNQAIERKLVRPLADLAEKERERLSLGTEEGGERGKAGGRVCIYLRAIPGTPTAEALAEAIPDIGELPETCRTPLTAPSLRLLFAAIKRSKLGISAEQIADMEEVKAAMAEYEQVLAGVKLAETNFKEFVVSTALRVSIRAGNLPVSAVPNSNGKGEGISSVRVATPVVNAPTPPTPAGTAEQNSTILNPIGKQDLKEPERSSLALNGPANRRIVEPTSGVEAPLVSSPRRQTSAAPASSSDMWVDQTFANHLRAAFVDAGKDGPSTPQIARVQKALPDDQEARLQFVDRLRNKMFKIKGPGVLDYEVESFIAEWPLLLAKKEAEFAQEQKYEAIEQDRAQAADQMLAIESQVDAQMEAMPAESRRARVAVLLPNLKRDFPRMSPSQLEDFALTRIRIELRDALMNAQFETRRVS